MNKRAVTYEEVKEAVLALPADGKNPGCYYTAETPEGVKHCAAGQVFVDLGIPCPTYPANAFLNSQSLAASSKVWDWLVEQGTTFDPQAEKLLSDLQDLLDSADGLELTWGEARDRVLSQS